MNFKKEKILDEFIDDLNKDQKPRAYKEDIATPEMEKEFEMVRKLKRYQQLEEAGEIQGDRNRGKADKKRWYLSRPFKGTVVAACFLLLFFFGGILTDEDGTSIVKAMVENYAEISSYRAEVDVTIVEEGEVTGKELREIEFKKPDLYKAVETWNHIKRTNISDGETLWEVIESKDGSTKNITVEPLFPEKELWRYHLGTQISGIADAEVIREKGKEEIAGRSTRVFEYKYEEKEEHWHKIWIDEEKEFPLKIILRGGHESELIVEYRELEINPSFAEDTFTLDVDTEEYEKRESFNRVVEDSDELTRLTERDIYFLDEGIKEELGLELNKKGYIDTKWLYQGVLRYKDSEDNFLDLYQGEVLDEDMLLFGGGEVGQLGEDNLLEYREDVVGVFDNYPGAVNLLRFRVDGSDLQKDEIALVSSLNREILLDLAENITGEEVELFDDEVPPDFDYRSPVEREGH